MFYRLINVLKTTVFLNLLSNLFPLQFNLPCFKKAKNKYKKYPNWIITYVKTYFITPIVIQY